MELPDGSVEYTADLRLNSDTYTAIFADDTVIMAVHIDPYSASELIPRNLDYVNMWMRLWRMKANEVKSTFTLRKQRCLPVKINNTPIPHYAEKETIGHKT